MQHSYHYELIAKVISNLNLPTKDKITVTLAFSKEFSKDNKLFDAQKFYSSVFSTIENLQQKGGEK